MLPAPKLRDGQTVAAADLAGRIHYDGGHMVAEEIVSLCDAFMRRRCAIDVEHDGKPRGATVVESWIQREPSSVWTLGAWIVGLQIHDDDVWEQVERGDLRAFSIQFVVAVRSFMVQLVEPDGSMREIGLREFTNAQPQFLSLVKQPATGATWKIKQRAVRPLAGPIVDRAWDADAARRRVEQWAREEDGRELADAFAVYDADGGGVQVADVHDGALVVVRSRLQADDLAQAELDAEETGRLASWLLGQADRLRGQQTQLVLRTVVPFQDLPLAEDTRAWDAQAAQNRVVAWAGGSDDWDPEKLRRAFLWYDSERPDLLGSYKLGIGDVVDGELTAIPRGIFAAAGRLDQTDVPAGDLPRIRAHLGRYYEKMERTPPWDEEERDMTERTDQQTEDVERDATAEQFDDAGTEELDDAADAAVEQVDEEDKGAEPDAEEPVVEETPTEEAEAPAVEDEQSDVEEDAHDLAPEDATDSTDDEAEAVDEQSDEGVDQPPQLYAVIDGEPVVAPDDWTGPVFAFDAQGGFVPYANPNATEPAAEDAADTPDAEASEPDGAGEPAADAEATVSDEGSVDEEEQRAAPAVGRAMSFGEAVGEGEFAEALYHGAHALHSAAMGILRAELEPADKMAALQGAINDFAQWALNQVALYGTAAFTTDDSPLAMTRAELVERAGRKMAGKRLKRLRGAVQELMALLEELAEGGGNEQRSKEEEDTPPASQVERKLDELAERVEQIVRNRRPAPSLDADGVAEPAAASSPVDLVRGAMF